MGLGDRNLSAGIINRDQAYGGRAYEGKTEGRYNDIVQETLARNTGGRKRFQNAGRLYSPSQEDINAMSNEEFDRFIQNAQARSELGAEDNMIGYDSRTDANSGSGGGGGETDPFNPTVEEAPVYPINLENPNGNAVAPDNWVDPRIPYTGPDVQRATIDDGFTLVPNDVAPLGSTIVGLTDPSTENNTSGNTPQRAPNWWQQNKEGISNGLMNVGAGLAGIAPNIANINDYNDLPGVRSPNLRRTVQTEAPSFEADRQAIIGQGRNASQRAKDSGSGDQIAANAQAMAGTQKALSQLSGTEARAQAQTDQRNAYAVNSANARNTQTLNKFLQDQTSRDLAQTRGIAGERNAIGNKTLGFVGDMRNQKLDRERMDLTRQRFDSTGVLERQLQKEIDETGEIPAWAATYFGQRPVPGDENYKTD